MQNQESIPNILPPVIPDSWCPKGTPAEMFNEYNQLFLRQAVVNIPGIGSLNPATIAEMQAQIISLQNQIDAQNRAFRSGTASVSLLNGVTTVPITPNMPNNNYTVILTMVDDGNAVTTDAPSISLVPNSKTTTQFQFRSHNLPTTWTVQWAAIQN